MTTIRAAAVQISPALYSREGTVDKVVQKIIELASQGVQFATFSETLVPYYPYFSYVQRPYETVAEHLRLRHAPLPPFTFEALSLVAESRLEQLTRGGQPP